jgi:pyruvate/2-oxoglutarate dehydrogenase complex dihydrolipoamide dehydrogenase (E3) component
LGENVSNPEEYDVVVLGSRVTVVDRNDALAHREDRDVSEALRGLFDDDRTSVNDNLPPKGYRTTVNTRQNGGIVSATSMRIRSLHHE